MNITRRKRILLAMLFVLVALGVFYAVLTLSYKSPPAGGHLRVFAFYGTQQSDGSNLGSYVQASVTVAGPESHTGTTTTDRSNPLNFTVVPGQYSISGTYDSTMPQNGTVNVPAGSYRDVYLNFGSTPLPP